MSAVVHCAASTEQGPGRGRSVCLTAGGPSCAQCLASVQQYGLALNRGSYLLVYKVNKLLMFAVKNTNSVLVISLSIMVTTCCGLS